jgi:AmmeMemoRadiSam system protein B
MIRTPAVAGYFYPANRDELKRQIGNFLPARDKLPAHAIVVPHAGYIYSGHVAGEVYASVELPETFIILCPNHTGEGSDIDLYPEGAWATPLGNVGIDSELSDALLRRFPTASKDGRAHLREHSLEVQLPFLQYLKGNISFLPICIREFRYPLLQELAHALSEMIRTSKRKTLLIASSDMTHYESGDSAAKKDQLAIKQIEALNARGLYDTVHQFNISMCGYLPVTVAILAANELGATRGTLLKYANSGDITRDYSQVVGYAGMLID